MTAISDTSEAGDEGEGSRLDFVCDLEHVACTAEAGFSLRRAEGPPGASRPAKSDVGRDVRMRLQVKKPKYSGKANWEAFHAQLKLAAVEAAAVAALVAAAWVFRVN